MKKNTRTHVIVINRNGESVLVQYVADGITERKYIPAAELGDKNVLDEVLERGINYGYPWEDLVINLDSQKLAGELRNVGLWTAEDVLRNPQKVWSAMNAAFAETVTTILQTAKFEKRGKQ